MIARTTGDRGACRNESRAVTEGDHCSRVSGPPSFSSLALAPGASRRRESCCYRRGSTGSLSSARTANTHSCTRLSGSWRAFEALLASLDGHVAAAYEHAK